MEAVDRDEYFIPALKNNILWDMADSIPEIDFSPITHPKIYMYWLSGNGCLHSLSLLLFFLYKWQVKDLPILASRMWVWANSNDSVKVLPFFSSPFPVTITAASGMRVNTRNLPTSWQARAAPTAMLSIVPTRRPAELFGQTVPTTGTHLLCVKLPVTGEKG